MRLSALNNLGSKARSFRKMYFHWQSKTMSHFSMVTWIYQLFRIWKFSTQNMKHFLASVLSDHLVDSQKEFNRKVGISHPFLLPCSIYHDFKEKAVGMCFEITQPLSTDNWFLLPESNWTEDTKTRPCLKRENNRTPPMACSCRPVGRSISASIRTSWFTRRSRSSTSSVRFGGTTCPSRKGSDSRRWLTGPTHNRLSRPPTRKSTTPSTTTPRWSRTGEPPNREKCF